MPFVGVVRRPAYAQVADQIRKAVLSGDLPPGSALPPERDLVLRFQVSRTTIREALRSLQAQGLIVSTGPNSPLRITEAETLSAGPVRDALTNLMQLGRIPLPDLVELRCALEAGAVELASKRAGPEHLAAVAHQVEIMRSITDDVVAYVDADLCLHLALVKASRNEALNLVMLAVRDSIESYLLEALAGVGLLGETFARLTREHEAILAAVESGNAELAQALMRAHVRAFYSGYGP
jgi:DNA-binding FadR family transcriptional regulator